MVPRHRKGGIIAARTDDQATLRAQVQGRAARLQAICDAWTQRGRITREWSPPSAGPASSRRRTLREIAVQFLLDFQQDHDGQDDQGSHGCFLRLAAGSRSNMRARSIASMIRSRIRKLRCGPLSRVWIDAPD